MFKSEKATLAGDMRDQLLEELKNNGVDDESIRMVKEVMRYLIHYISVVEYENYCIEKECKNAVNKMLTSLKTEKGIRWLLKEEGSN